MRDNFERFGNYLFTNAMRSSVCNTKKFCYIVLVVKNIIGKVNVVCEVFYNKNT